MTFYLLFSSSEALNLSDSPPNLTTIKREREREPSPETNERDEFHHHQPPPTKRASFYLPSGMGDVSVAAAATNFHYKGDHQLHSDVEADEENEEEEGNHNATVNISHDGTTVTHQLNGESVRGPRHHGSSSSVHNDKSDDSAIENSPSTSAASAGNGHISPVSTKIIQLSKQAQQHNVASSSGTCAENMTAVGSPALSPFEALKLLSGMQFRVTRNGMSLYFISPPFFIFFLRVPENTFKKF